MALAYLLSPTFQVENSAGKPATGGWLEVFVSGSRDPYYCYSDFQGTLHPFKIPLDSLGSNVVLADDGQAYDVYVYNRYGGLLMSRYNVKPGHGAGGGGGTITSSDGSIDVTMTSTGYDLKVNGQEASALRAGANDLTSDGQFVFYELVRDGDHVTVDTNGKIRLEDGWYHYDVTARVKWEDGVTVANTENHVQLYTTLNSDIIPFDCSYEHEDTLHLHGQVKITTGGSQFVVGVQGIEQGMSIELVDCGLFAITGNGDAAEYEAGDGIIIDDHEISIDPEIVQEKLTAGDNIQISEENVISATDTTYTAGTGLELDGTEFSVDTTVIQEKLTAGSNIVIEGNTISATAEPQQQADWTETDTSDVSYIKHKPGVKPVVAGNNITITEGNDSFTISATADPQVQADWAQTDSTAVDYIQNKPNLALKEDVANKAQTVIASSTTDYPSSAATAQFVNSSVATSTANFLGNYTLTDLGLTYPATDSQIETALDAYSFQSAPTNNDYVYVEIQNPQTTSVDDMVKRFKFNGTNWLYEYTLNNSSFTAAEIAAIDSGVNATKVGNYDTHIADTTIHVTAADKTAWNGKQDAISDLSTIRSGAAAGATAVQPGSLATVATSGSYNDLTDKPTIPAAQVNSDWNASAGVAAILNKPTLSSVATSGSYNDLTDKLVAGTNITIDANNVISATGGGTAQVNSDWEATSGVAEILNKPTEKTLVGGSNVSITEDNDTVTISAVAAAQVNADWDATSGVAQILNKPVIPAAQVNSDWEATEGVAEILNKPDEVQLVAGSNITIAESGNQIVISASSAPSQVNSDWDATSGVAQILHKPDLSVYATTAAMNTALAGKQDTISDLATIRSGAAAGASAVQPSALATVATTGSYTDLSDKPSIPVIGTITL